VGKSVEGNCARRVRSLRSISIIGPNGQLGSDLVKTFQGAGWKVNLLGHEKIKVENFDSVTNALKENKSEWIINTAAFHRVDECEKDSQKAWEINVSGAKNVAVAARNLGIQSVFISSDFVYSGNKESFYSESDPVSPINAYGHSKAAGEAVTLAANSKNLVIRISSVFGAAGSSGKGGNFVETILNKARQKESLNVVGDIFMSPTYTVDAANKILELLTRNESGIFNASNSGVTSWHEFANEILNQTELRTTLQASETNWEALPKRPRNSSLDVSKVEQFVEESPTWIEGLRKYLAEKGHI
jgi:dTDP-4-dehydrorhamnose reductase